MTDKEKEIVCKVVLLGESGVGKTSIIQNYIFKKFNNNANISTIGINFQSKEMNFEEEEKKIKFEIWDTAGQEKYHSLAKIFFQDASVCILVYDITVRQSFEQLKNFWVKEVKTYSKSNTSKHKFKIIFIFNSPCCCWK